MRSVSSECSVAQARVSGRFVSLVDTPALLNTQMNQEHLMKEISRSVCLSSPGPHAIPIVLRLDRFTAEEQQIPQMMEEMFGEEMLKYSIILFTGGDQLRGETIKELIEQNGELRAVLAQCGSRYQPFNNIDENNRHQVEDLLQKIDSIIQQNGGAHYTNQMTEDAYRRRRGERFREKKLELRITEMIEA
ncbi:GTPase IMAP family member 9-like [Danio aesculapii]|uniref:GTPase IMAP family member 9-like n=1 Tax=Danio aesculapii TaxID=1142201 RepID=UPI0024C04571|nr:GTPase IMAP family member 9-like [Danio aesculapii]